MTDDEEADDVDELDDDVWEVVDWVDVVCLVDVVLVVVWVLEWVFEVVVGGVQVVVGLALVFSCVVVGGALGASPPPPPPLPNDQLPWSSPTLKGAKDENKPEEKSRPPYPHPIHCVGR